MNTNDCERVRLHLMASADHEAERPSPRDHEHVSGCAACRQWLEDFESLTSRLHGVAYPPVQADMWSAVEKQIHHVDPTPSLTRQLAPVIVLTLAWRVLQLFVDLPVPAVHSLVPVAAAAFVAWRAGSRLLAIETWAPELQKRGI